MAFIRQTLWLSLWMAEVSLTAGNGNTRGLLRRDRIFSQAGKEGAPQGRMDVGHEGEAGSSDTLVENMEGAPRSHTAWVLIPVLSWGLRSVSLEQIP